MSFSDKKKLDSLENYTLKKATDALLGGILTGYTNNGKNYKVELDDNGRAFVNVPWTDTIYDDSECIKTSGDQTIKGNLTIQTISTTDANIIVDTGRIDIRENSEGIEFSENNTKYITVDGNASTNQYFAPNGTIQTLPEVEAISDDFINALS